MKQSMDFGEFIYQKRMQANCTLRAMAAKLNIAAVYLSDIEKGRRNPPEKGILSRMIKEYGLNDEEKCQLYDLAAIQKDKIPEDLSEYIMHNENVMVALRQAKKFADNEDWKEFSTKLKQKGV